MKITCDKDNLSKLEQTGNFVFHGSASKIDELEPRQPYTFSKEAKKMVEDGERSVVASPRLKIAIFRAIINRANTPKEHNSSFDYKDNKFFFTASKITIGQAKDKIGFVHVLDRKDFYKHSDMEWRSEKKVKPLCVVKVGFNDLPKDIKIKNFD